MLSVEPWGVNNAVLAKSERRAALSVLSVEPWGVNSDPGFYVYVNIVLSVLSVEPWGVNRERHDHARRRVRTFSALGRAVGGESALIRLLKRWRDLFQCSRSSRGG